MRAQALILAFLFAAVSPHTFAKEKWILGGFVSQHAIHTTDNYMLGPSDDGMSLDYRELALIVRGGVTEQLSFSSQLLSRKAGNAEDGTPKLDYVFFNWRVYDSISLMSSVTVGRIKVPIGFYNDLRESPFTRNGLLLPQSLYPERSRNSTMAADQILLTHEFRFTDWTLNIAAGAGPNKADKEEATDNFDVDPDQWDLTVKDTNRWNVRLLSDFQEGKFRAAVTVYSVPVEFSAALHVLPGIDVPLEGKAEAVWKKLSFEYNAEAYSVTTEFYRAVVKYEGVELDPTDPDYHNVPEGGYVQFTYRFNPKFEFFTRYDRMVFDRKDKNGKYYASLMPAVPHYARFSKDSVLGAAYRPTPDWLIRLEIHTLDGSLWMTRRDAPKHFVPERYWNLVGASVSWRF